MNVITDQDRLRAQINCWHAEGCRIAFVPTMGNLHAGHCALMAAALQQADRLIVSVFVNPTQFAPHEDFDHYPRTPSADIACVAAQGGHAIWFPTAQEIYPFGVAKAGRIHLPDVSQILEGACRPGHFDGVCTVVARLFLHVQPTVAVFGQKDYQQLAIIQRLVADFAFPIQIVGVDTVRETDGLALSSRNQYLTPQQRRVAAEIWQTLLSMRQADRSGSALAEVEQQAALRLHQAGFAVDYAVVRSLDLADVSSHEGQRARVALIAARLGTTRLIDNLQWEPS